VPGGVGGDPWASRRPAAVIAVAVALVIGAIGLAAVLADIGPFGDDEQTARGLRGEFDSALHENLVGQQGLTEAQADCVLNQLRETVPDEQIEATGSGEIPQAVIDAAVEAGADCVEAE
jgi:hypothetical protein